MTRLDPFGFIDPHSPLDTAIAADPVFADLTNEIYHEREIQPNRWPFIYPLSGYFITSQTVTTQFATHIVTFEADTDFELRALTGRVKCYHATGAQEPPPYHPAPNNMGARNWEFDVLSFRITDMSSARDLTADWIPAGLLLTPGYGLNMLSGFPLRYYLRKKSKLRFDIRCILSLDLYNKWVLYHLALHGHKILTP